MVESHSLPSGKRRVEIDSGSCVGAGFSPTGLRARSSNTGPGAVYVDRMFEERLEKASGSGRLSLSGVRVPTFLRI